MAGVCEAQQVAVLHVGNLHPFVHEAMLQVSPVQTCRGSSEPRSALSLVLESLHSEPQ